MWRKRNILYYYDRSQLFSRPVSLVCDLTSYFVKEKYFINFPALGETERLEGGAVGWEIFFLSGSEALVKSFKVFSPGD